MTIGEEETGFAVVEDVGELVGLRLGIHNHEGAASHQGPENRHDARPRVVHIDGNTIPALQSVRA